jgi:hypothetical protein
MSAAMSSITSTTKCENRSRAFATLRFAGDALDPDEITRVIKEQPTQAYRKGEKHRTGPHGPEIVGKTGMWYFSTRHKIPSKNLTDHLEALVRLVFPFADDGKRLRELRDIMERENLKAHVTCFWRGPPGANEPSIPAVVSEPLCRIPADIKVDFATE